MSTNRNINISPCFIQRNRDGCWNRRIRCSCLDPNIIPTCTKHKKRIAILQKNIIELDQ